MLLAFLLLKSAANEVWFGKECRCKKKIKIMNKQCNK